MIETKTKKIDGLTFHTTQLPPLRAYPLAARVAKLVLPALQRLGTTGLLQLKPDEFLKADAGKLIETFEPVINELAKPENEDLPLKLLVGTVAEIKDDAGDLTRISLASPEAINRVFQGKIFLMLKVMWFSTEVNFRDFFAGAFKGARIKAQVAEETESPTNSLQESTTPGQSIG